MGRIKECRAQKHTPAKKKENSMKNINRFLITAAALALFASASQALADGSSACCSTTSCCNDGIAASPKVRAMLNERCRNKCAPADQAVVRNTVTPQTTIAASPKVQAMLASQRTAPATHTESGYAGYRPVGDDGIAASPKLRSMLDERQQTVEVAPLK
jgi:hypothetical protein